jgi:hypothetical protein
MILAPEDENRHAFKFAPKTGCDLMKRFQRSDPARRRLNLPANRPARFGCNIIPQKSGSLSDAAKPPLYEPDMSLPIWQDRDVSPA